MAALTDYTKDLILNSLFNGAAFPTPSTTYLSVHTASPSGTGANEVSGGSYVRQVCSFTDSTGGAGQVSNDVIVEFQMPTVTVSHFALWDADTAGNCLWQGTLTDAGGNAVTRTFQDGDSLKFDTSSMTLSND